MLKEWSKDKCMVPQVYGKRLAGPPFQCLYNVESNSFQKVEEDSSNSQTVSFENWHVILSSDDEFYVFGDLFLGEGPHCFRGVFPGEQMRLWTSRIDSKMVV